MALKDIDALSDDEANAGDDPAKSSGENKADATVEEKRDSELPTKPEPKQKAKKQKQGEPETEVLTKKRPAAAAAAPNGGDDDQSHDQAKEEGNGPETEEPPAKKRPAAAPQKVLKRPAAASPKPKSKPEKDETIAKTLRAYKSQYKQTLVWGLKQNGKEVVRVGGYESSTFIFNNVAATVSHFCNDSVYVRLCLQGETPTTCRRREAQRSGCSSANINFLVVEILRVFEDEVWAKA